MTRAHLTHFVAARTGDPPRVVRRIGFQDGPPTPLDPEDVHLVVNCPSCGRPVPYPGRAGDGSLALAECADPGCDLFFGFDESEVYAT